MGAERRQAASVVVVLCAGLLASCAAPVPSPSSTPSNNPVPSPTMASASTSATPSQSPLVTGTTAAPAPSPPIVLPSGLPFTLRITEDSAHAVTTTIGATGGTISGAGADGTRFALSIPTDALPHDIAITVTPVASLAGLPPDDQLIAAVDMRPEGLWLYAPASLTITPAQPPPGNLVAFGYAGDGSSVHIADLEPDLAHLSIEISHFSGAGLASGGAAGFPPAGASGSCEGPYLDEIAASGSAWRFLALIGEEPIDQLPEDLIAKFQDVLAAWFTQCVRPITKAAEGNEGTLLEAVVAFLTWDHAVVGLGFQGSGSDPFAAQRRAARVSLALGFKNAMEARHAHCVSQGTFRSDIAVLLAYARQTQLLGLETEGAPSQADYEDRIDKCGTFTLAFKSTIALAVDAPHELQVTSVYTASLKLHWDRASLVTGEAAGTLAVPSISTDGPCTLYTEPRGDTLAARVTGLLTLGEDEPLLAIVDALETLRLFGPPDESSMPPVHAVLLYTPGLPSEDIRAYCSGSSSDYPKHSWQDYFPLFHADERPGTDEYIVSAWDAPGPPPTVAYKAYHRSHQITAGVRVSEDTTIEVKHTPT